MTFPSVFLCAGQAYSTYDRFVPAPFFRKTFFLEQEKTQAVVRITGLGFYRLWINGREITKGLLAPYISNPDELVYFDDYTLTPFLRAGKNVLGVQLGNGMQNAPGGSVWDFDLARYRGAPRFAFSLTVGGVCFSSDESVKTAPSPLYFDDLRCGVRYDARKEIPGWNLPEFDDSHWANAVRCAPPRGEYRLCEAPPVRVYKETPAVSVRRASLCDYTPTNRRVPEINLNPDRPLPERSGFLYDFGENNAGVFRLKLRGTPGQRVELQFGETCIDGDLDYQDIQFYPDGFGQRDVYICRGGEEEVFVPPFTYHGARYCLVLGITEAQAAPDLLTFLAATSEQAAAGGFESDDETLNTLYRMCEVSDRSNFYYFPTDCPQREKNGWTGDAQLSAQHMLMTIDCKDSLREWLRAVRHAQREDGSLPGIVPTCGWGYGTGPSWDAVIVELPYQIYVYTGDLTPAKESAAAILRYLHFGARTRDENGLILQGLGDWCPIGGKVKPAPGFTQTLQFMDSASKAAFLFERLGMAEERLYAEALAAAAKQAARRAFVEHSAAVVDNGCQTSLSMALCLGLLTPEETDAARKLLIESIRAAGAFMDVGILGARFLFHALADAGETALALSMITREEFPSYGHFIARGYTAMPEAFEPPEERNYSLNHHMFCDIKNFFISRVAGLRFNPDGASPDLILLSPFFPEGMAGAGAWFTAPQGKITVRWTREADGVRLHAVVPKGMRTALRLPEGYREKTAAASTGRPVDVRIETEADR